MRPGIDDFIATIFWFVPQTELLSLAPLSAAFVRGITQGFATSSLLQSFKKSVGNNGIRPTECKKYNFLDIFGTILKFSNQDKS